MTNASLFPRPDQDADEGRPWVAGAARVRPAGPGNAGPAPLREDFPAGPDGVASYVVARNRWQDTVFVERSFIAIARRWDRPDWWHRCRSRMARYRTGATGGARRCPAAHPGQDATDVALRWAQRH